MVISVVIIKQRNNIDLDLNFYKYETTKYKLKNTTIFLLPSLFYIYSIFLY